MCSKTDKAKTRKMMKQHAVLVTVSTCPCFPENYMVNENQEHRNTEQRNTEYRRNSGTPRNSGGTTEHYPEHQQNTPEQRNHTKPRTIAVF